VSFLAELKRRRVVRIAIVYGAVAFALLQAADILAPALRLPQWTMTLVVLLLGLGLPIALVIAWAFELTPDGVQRTAARAATAPPTPDPAERWISARTIALAALLLALGVAAGWLIKPGSGAPRWLMARSHTRYCRSRTSVRRRTSISRTACRTHCAASWLRSMAWW
jgi:hypothetical protein